MSKRTRQARRRARQYKIEGRRFAPRALRMVKRFLSLMISLCAGSLLIIDGPFDEIRFEGPVGASRDIAIILILSIAARIAVSSYFPSDAISLYNAELPSRALDSQLLTAAQDAFSSIATNAEVLHLLDMFADPGKYVIRISEKAILGEQEYSTSVHRTIVLSETQVSESVLVPVLAPVKGTIIDNLRVVSGTTQLRTLTYRETQGAQLTIGRLLIRSLFANATSGDELWNLVQKQILLPNRATRIDADDILGKLNIAKQNLDLKDADTRARLSILTNFIIDILDTMPIIAVVPAAKTLEVTCEYTESKSRVPMTDVEPKNIFHIVGVGVIQFWEWMYSYVRASFGLTRRSHNLRLQHATRAQSYHFHAQAPDGLYIYHLGYGFKALQAKYSGSVQPSEFSDRPRNAYWNVSDTRGSTYIHAYGRDLDIAVATAEGNLSTRMPFLRIELRERPPGLMLVVVLLSLFLALLTAAIGHWHDTVFGIEINQLCRAWGNSYVECLMKKDTQAYWPTILFGVPAIISGWLVARFTADAVSRLSVSTLLVASWCILNSALAMLLAALGLSVLLANHQSYWIFDFIQPLWSLLVISTCSTTVMACMLLILRVRRYRRRASGLIKSDDTTREEVST